MSEPAQDSHSASRKSVWPMFVVGLGMIALFWGATEIIRSWIPTGSNEEAVRSAERVKNLQELHETDRRDLGTYGWVDKEKGLVRIPIERAMELEVAVLNSKKPAAAYPIQGTPAPAAPAVAAPDAAAAPAATPATDAPAAPTAPADPASPATPPVVN